MNPDEATSWVNFFSDTGGWGVAVVVGFVLGSIVVYLARRYDKHRDQTEALFQGMIKDQTELLTMNKHLNEQLVALMTKTNERLDRERRG